jgi:oligosaccharyltransferase complex subunit beta
VLFASSRFFIFLLFSHSHSLQHTAVLAKNTINNKAILGDFNGKSSQSPVVYKGIAHTMNKDNVLGVNILKGNPTSYSFFANKPMNEGSGPFSSADDSLLVSGIQGRNNARVLISGSIEMFSNAFYRGSDGKESTGNRQFLQNVSKWVLREAGVLRFRNITHHKLDGSPPELILHEKERPDLPLTLYPDPEITRNSLVYRIKENIVYSMIVEEWNGNEWKPFNADDMQMEFVMLDAHIRKTMKCDSKNGKFSTTFMAPDRYGVFKFRVLYRRLGYSVLHAETQVSIRPFKHNEYERFIFSAFPYYSSCFSAMIGLFIFSICFLFSSADDSVSSHKKDKKE